MAKRKSAIVGPLGAVTILAFVASIIGTGLAEGKAHKGGTKTPAAKSAASAKPGAEAGRTPGSGSCNNDTNKCSGAGETCRNNLCYCGEGFARCHPYKPGDDDSKDCTNLRESADDCSACGKKCPAKAECDKGKCVACKAGETACPAKHFNSNGYRDGISPSLRSCVSLKEDEGNCGKCNHECPEDYSCVNGHCVP